MNQTAIQDIRGVLIQVEGARLLLPNATIAEVLSYADPEPVADAPHWLLGRIRWRGWQLPLASFSRLAGIADEAGGLGSKVVVLKALVASITRSVAAGRGTRGSPASASKGVLVSDPELLPDAPVDIRPYHELFSRVLFSEW